MAAPLQNRSDFGWIRKLFSLKPSAPQGKSSLKIYWIISYSTPKVALRGRDVHFWLPFSYLLKAQSHDKDVLLPNYREWSRDLWSRHSEIILFLPISNQYNMVKISSVKSVRMIKSVGTLQLYSNIFIW